MKAFPGLAASILALQLILNMGCSSHSHSSEPQKMQATDYSQVNHWLCVSPVTQTVDVFYLYPTAWLRGANDDVICTIDNPSMLMGSNSAFGRSASAFQPIANIFAPYYRQADAVYTLSLPPEERDKVVGGIPTLDATAAFDYYLKKYNPNRPFFLVGHSQGSNILMFLLSGYLKDHPEVYKRMIAAYIIGYSVTDTFLAKNPHLKFAEGPDDTGVIISYNTQSPNVASGANPVVIPGALAINPISWKRDETVATTAMGLGSYMPDPVTKEFKEVPQYADARIDQTKNAIICSTADEALMHALSPGFSAGVYHSFDYLFYYYNLRANAANRKAKFLTK